MDRLDDLNLQVFPGSGVVARTPGACLVAISRNPRQAATAQYLVEVTRSAISGDERRLMRRIAGSIAVARPGDVPSFCAVAEIDGELVVILHGSLQVTVRRQSGVECYSGAGGVTWVERTIPLPVCELEVTPELAFAPPPQDHLDLRAGVVRGDGFRLAGAASAGTADLASVSAIERRRERSDEQSSTSGYLVLDDGAMFGLDRAYVIGDDPQQRVDPGGHPAILSLRDPEQRISPRHALVALDDRYVRITDCHSLDGTYVCQPGELRWTRLVPGKPTKVPPGTQIRIGERTLLFDSQRGVDARERGRERVPA